MSKQSILTFDRWDVLGTRAILCVIALAITGSGVVSPLIQWMLGDPLRWTVVTGRSTPLAPPDVTAKSGVDLTWAGDVEVSIPDASAAVWLASILPGLLIAIATTIVVISLMRLLSLIQSSDMFGRAALRALRLVGLVLLLGSILVSVTGEFANSVVLDAALTLDGNPIPFTLDSGAALVVATAGLVCAALAEAFGRLAEEVDGLI